MSQQLVSQEPVEIFISYSRRDKPYADELRKHLSIYEMQGRIRVWYDGNLTPGAEWEEEIYDHFRSASIILLLVSPDFFASEYCTRREMPEALQQHAAQNAQVVPVILRPVEWQRTELAKLMVLPLNSKPVDEWTNQDQYYQSVSKSLFDHVDAKYPATDEETSIWDQDAPTGGLDRGSSKREERPSAQRSAPVSAKANTPVSAKASAAVSAKASAPSSARTDVPVPVTMASPASNSQSSAEEYRAAVEAFVPEIVVCFLHRERRPKLLKLRRWCQNTGDPLFGERAARVVEAASLEDAVQRVAAGPNTREAILLLDGFEPGSPQLDETMETVQRQRRLNMIVNEPEWENYATHKSSASILQSLFTVTSDETLLATLRKALLRVRTREFARASVLDTKEELEAVFRLRYRVWHQLGYLSDAKRAAEVPWELDYTDRTALPLGVFSKIDGSLIGGARLVRGLGEEYSSQIRTITEMLREKKAESLIRNFEYPTTAAHPYDILGELQRFQEYYRDLVRHRVSKAEVSRVVVDPDYRKLGLGEVIVDTLCSLARTNAVDVLFLACHKRHVDFYRRSHFEVVSGVSGESFLTYRVPCVAMERRFT